MSFIKAFFKKRRSKKNLRQLKALHATFATLQKAETGNLLWFDKKNRRLFIEEPLAIVMMSTAKMWQNFLQNIFTWLYWRQSQEAWDAFILKEELSAVRRAKRRTPLLTKQDVERIRYARRQEIGMSDIEAPKVEPFEFFVIRTQLNDGFKTSKDASTIPGGEVLAVGNYEPQSGMVEMATWEEVRQFIQKDDSAR